MLTAPEMRSRCAALAAALALAPAIAAAHIVADPAEAAAGTYQAVRLRVGHACSDAGATTAVRVEVPTGLASVRPQPKPGWTLQIERAKGEPSTVTAITWRGALPPDQFDEFAVLVRLPEQAGVLYFPTVQTCGREETRWTEIPRDGEARPAHPAPMLRVKAAAQPPQAGHHH
jgi:uncharacterized protein YcnI